jgi:sulfide:quinone oxidoreductase
MRTVEVLVVGGGAAGIAVAASLLRRRSEAAVAIVEPQDKHYYQPAWTLVAGGLFDPSKTERPMRHCIPKGVQWIRASVAAFDPAGNAVVLDDGERIGYRVLVICPGLQLNWHAIEGLPETLGRNGVTSNYRFELASYTWQLVRTLREGAAIFTQPPMPIKCPAAPLKALYLSSDIWRRRGTLGRIEVKLNISGAALFSVPLFVPALLNYVDRYNAALSLKTTLAAIDGPARKAWFEIQNEDGSVRRVAESFDMIHVVPPQSAPDFVRRSPLANGEGWVDVDPATLRHRRYDNVFSLGDACSAPCTKTAAAVRKQAPVVATNIAAQLSNRQPCTTYDGYGSCPIVVERGKVLLAEFGYGGTPMATFPLDPVKPRRSFWFMKRYILPFVYWHLMMTGREVLAGPTGPARIAP